MAIKAIAHRRLAERWTVLAFESVTRNILAWPHLSSFWSSFPVCVFTEKKERNEKWKLKTVRNYWRLWCWGSDVLDPEGKTTHTAVCASSKPAYKRVICIMAFDTGRHEKCFYAKSVICLHKDKLFVRVLYCGACGECTRMAGLLRNGYILLCSWKRTPSLILFYSDFILLNIILFRAQKGTNAKE